MGSIPDFYVYVLMRPNGRPFYVGKGSGNRINEHQKSRKVAAAFRRAEELRARRKDSFGLKRRGAFWLVDDTVIMLVFRIGMRYNGPKLHDRSASAPSAVSSETCFSKPSGLVCAAA